MLHEKANTTVPFDGGVKGSKPKWMDDFILSISLVLYVPQGVGYVWEFEISLYITAILSFLVCFPFPLQVNHAASVNRFLFLLLQPRHGTPHLKSLNS